MKFEATLRIAANTRSASLESCLLTEPFNDRIYNHEVFPQSFVSFNAIEWHGL